MKTRKKMKRGKTAGGWAVIQFEDCYGAKCNIQESSSAEEIRIWLGCEDLDLKVLGDNGWKDYDVPKPYCANTRMHLNQKQVAALLPILQKFVYTGEI